MHSLIYVKQGKDSCTQSVETSIKKLEKWISRATQHCEKHINEDKQASINSLLQYAERVIIAAHRYIPQQIADGKSPDITAKEHLTNAAKKEVDKISGLKEEGKKFLVNLYILIVIRENNKVNEVFEKLKEALKFQEELFTHFCKALKGPEKYDLSTAAPIISSGITFAMSFLPKPIEALTNMIFGITVNIIAFVLMNFHGEFIRKVKDKPGLKNVLEQFDKFAPVYKNKSGTYVLEYKKEDDDKLTSAVIKVLNPDLHDVASWTL